MNTKKLLNKANIAYNSENYALAQKLYLEVIEHEPTNAVAYTNLGVCFFAQNLLDEAAECFLAANKVDPNYIQAVYNYSHLLLLKREYYDGFDLYRTRYDERIRGNGAGGVAYPPTLLTPNDSIKGKTLYISHEQGFGDTINFARYYPMFLAEGARVISYVPESLIKLFARAYPEVEFILPGSDITFDFNCPLAEAAYLFGTTYESVPFGKGYLSVDADDAAELKKRLGINGAKPKIGFNYKGSQGKDAVKNRSIELTMILEKITPLREDFDFYCLQYERTPAEDTLLDSHAIPNLGVHIKDFYDTALLIEAMDAVFSIDTSFLHLAGALGKKGFGLLKFHPDWRWSLHDEKSAWYESLTLIRQRKAHDWGSVMDDLITKLKNEIV